MRRRDRYRRLAGGAAIAAVAVLTGVGLWQTSRPGPARSRVTAAEPRGIMGTSCTLAAVSEEDRGAAALSAAEGALREVEARMSRWLDDSEIARLNGAPAGEEVALSAETREVMRRARRAWEETGGAFDVTCGPVIEAWREAGKRGRRPSEEELQEARATSSWELLELTEGGARKKAGSVQVDLGGIAKGYGIDRAAEAMREAGAEGGMVDVGGDLRCFGRPPSGDAWKVEVRDPFREGTLVELAVRAAGVCTSGNYARFVMIQGMRYSHIVDPRTGYPAEAAPSVTVVAEAAAQADVWATALSVLGREGVKRLPAGVEAMLVIGEPGDYETVCTPGFEGMMREGRKRLRVETGGAGE